MRRRSEAESLKNSPGQSVFDGVHLKFCRSGPWRSRHPYALRTVHDIGTDKDESLLTVLKRDSRKIFSSHVREDQARGGRSF